MQHEALSLHTADARSAAEMVARLQDAAAEEGIKVTAEDNVVTIDLANPVLAGLVRGVSRGIGGLVSAVSSLTNPVASKATPD